MLAKLNKLTNWQAAVIIAAVGFAVYFTGLTNPFQGDDVSQIVNNVPVHSISNIKLFFEGGTFYNGGGLTPLSGVYFRPLMTTIFSLIYTAFGPHPFYFHLLQLLLSVGSAIFLYLFFRYSFKPALALSLALIFLIHPLDSQVVFAIPSMQDALFFFFGILAMWLLLRFHSIKSLLLVALCLLMSMLAKETGVLFLAIALLYLFWFDQRKRLYSFVGAMVLPLALYVLLKTHAVGFVGVNPDNAPIDRLSLLTRLITAPSIPAFYFSKLIFPWKLASAYYWDYTTISFRHFLLPLIVDLILVVLIGYMAIKIRNKASKAIYFSYLFFTTWFFLGIILTLQIIPLDMTVCETWFYFSMAGFLGMLGVVITTLGSSVSNHRRLVVGLALAIIIALGGRTAIRGTDWSSEYTLAQHDVAASKEDYVADNEIAEYYASHSNFIASKTYAEHSVAIFPYVLNYTTLGNSQFSLGDYAGAYAAYTTGTKYKPYVPLYENLAATTLVYGNTSLNRQYLLEAVDHFPRDSVIWMYLAILEERTGNNSEAKIAITQAAENGQVPQFIYYSIMNDRPFTINLPASSIAIP